MSIENDSIPTEGVDTGDTITVWPATGNSGGGGKVTPAESSAAIHSTAKWSTAQLQKTQAEQAARVREATAAQAKAKANRDALTQHLKDIVNNALHKNNEPPAVIGLAHENNKAMEMEAARLNAARAEREAREKAEAEAKKAEEALKAAQKKKEDAARQLAETERQMKIAAEQEKIRAAMSPQARAAMQAVESANLELTNAKNQLATEDQNIKKLQGKLNTTRTALSAEVKSLAVKQKEQFSLTASYKQAEALVKKLKPLANKPVRSRPFSDAEARRVAAKKAMEAKQVEVAASQKKKTQLTSDLNNTQNALNTATEHRKQKAQQVIGAEKKLNDAREVFAKQKAAEEKAVKIADLMHLAGIQPQPSFSQEKARAATSAMSAAGVMALGRLTTPAAMQISITGSGVWTATGELLHALTGSIERGVAALAGTAMAGSAGAMVAAATPLFWSAPVGTGSDRIPGRDMEALFALNAGLLAGKGAKIEPGMTHVDMPVRGTLVDENGQMVLKLLKTGGSLPKAVQVLNALRDDITGLDRITIPAAGGGPARTILINPVPAPATPSHTGNLSPAPVTPVHTGIDVKPVANIVTTTTPVADVSSVRDFIYWQPDATGTGVQPVYVMLSGPYGETNTKGKYSGREYNADKAGGPVQDLDWKGATIDRDGVDRVKLHTGRFGESPDNKVMIERLEKILKGELQATDTDKRFYTHEIRELERYRALGVPDGAQDKDVWNNAHTATLEDYKVNEKTQPLYTPAARDAYDKAELEQYKRGK